ncbi:osmotically inducible protein OsmC [Longibacter salinarum]|uniref:Osmotically inducible protein OsmC n=1 Tax=Longibacter salinarum TaxID=1850348 RepID=A0A2A8CUB2_9BACT|nr:OsmC family protein [Longibacter salinarum]PEN11492.1 osmotically inducible protein OsmC [Longibacter salinarum]
MVHIDVSYEGQLRCRATHEPSGNQLHTDAPVDNHGRGETFSPTDLVATGLGTCIVTIMGIYANKHDLDLGEMTVSIDKEMDGPPRHISKLTVTVDVPHAFDEKTERALRNAAEGCPVAKSLGPNTEIDLTIRFGQPVS